jgi:23S rRNA (uracil1939-C5)-methyltransferase
MLTVGNQIEVHAIDVDYRGFGVAKYQDFVVFVADLLEGEEALVEISKVQKRFAEATLVERKIKSEHRSNYALTLGAADLIHMTNEAERKWILKTTKETLFKIADLDVSIGEIIGSEKTENYRHKAVFHVMPHPILRFGLYKHNAYKLLQVDAFILAHPVINQIIKTLTSSNIKVDHEKVKHVVIRVNQKGEALVTFVATQKTFKGLNRSLEILKPLPFIVGVTINLKLSERSILGPESDILYGKNQIIETLNGFDYIINDRSFFQINPPVIEKVYELMKSYIDQDSSVIDAYSGVGVIGFAVSSQAKKVTMIEQNKNNVRLAKKNIAKYQLTNIDIFCAKAEEVLQTNDADILIVDPPRTGLASLMVDLILEKRFKKVIYLSCDLKTLARDLKSLTQKYSIQSINPIQMFPHTTNVESLTVLVLNQ